jgi:hypothetical protein
MIFNFCVCLSLTNEQAEQHILMTIRAQILASVDQYPTKTIPYKPLIRGLKKGPKAMAQGTTTNNSNALRGG